MFAAPIPAVLVRAETVPTVTPPTVTGISKGVPRVFGPIPGGVADATNSPD